MELYQVENLALRRLGPSEGLSAGRLDWYAPNTVLGLAQLVERVHSLPNEMECPPYLLDPNALASKRVAFASRLGKLVSEARIAKGGSFEPDVLGLT